jgi:hypothetical protein
MGDPDKKLQSIDPTVYQKISINTPGLFNVHVDLTKVLIEGLGNYNVESVKSDLSVSLLKNIMDTHVNFFNYHKALLFI